MKTEERNRLDKAIVLIIATICAAFSFYFGIKYSGWNFLWGIGGAISLAFVVIMVILIVDDS